jgi:hypothetical protein
MVEYEFKLRRQPDGSFWIACQYLVGLKWLPVFVSPKTEHQFREWLSRAQSLLSPEIAHTLRRQAFEGESAQPIRFRSGMNEMKNLGCRMPQGYAPFIS